MPSRHCGRDTADQRPEWTGRPCQAAVAVQAPRPKRQQGVDDGVPAQRLCRGEGEAVATAPPMTTGIIEEAAGVKARPNRRFLWLSCRVMRFRKPPAPLLGARVSARVTRCAPVARLLSGTPADPGRKMTLGEPAPPSQMPQVCIMMHQRCLGLYQRLHRGVPHAVS